jgi:hypothetical protein
MKNDTTTNALELLRSQHEEVEGLIEEIEDSDDPAVKEELFLEMADKLAAHAMIEEKMFYPAVMIEDTREQLVEATEEHLEVKRLLADMMELDVEDEHFDAKLTVLKEDLRHHIHDEEEPKLFREAEKQMSDDELAALGNEMLAMFEMLLEHEPRKQVPSETAEAAELQPMF